MNWPKFNGLCVRAEGYRCERCGKAAGRMFRFVPEDIVKLQLLGVRSPVGHAKCFPRDKNGNIRLHGYLELNFHLELSK